MIIKLGKVEINTKKVKESIGNLFKKVKPKCKPRKVWNMWEHKGWGDRIAWLDFKKQSLEGHMGDFGNRVHDGDELRCKMQNGQIARFRIIDVEYQFDSSDQFFARASFEGYVEGVKIDPKTGEIIKGVPDYVTAVGALNQSFYTTTSTPTRFTGPR